MALKRQIATDSQSASAIKQEIRFAKEVVVLISTPDNYCLAIRSPCYHAFYCSFTFQKSRWSP